MEIPRELSDYKQVLQLATTPSSEEFSRVSKIAGAGIVLIGLLGFIVFALMTFFPG